MQMYLNLVLEESCVYVEKDDALFKPFQVGGVGETALIADLGSVVERPEDAPAGKQLVGSTVA